MSDRRLDKEVATAFGPIGGAISVLLAWIAIGAALGGLLGAGVVAGLIVVAAAILALRS